MEIRSKHNKSSIEDTELPKNDMYCVKLHNQLTTFQDYNQLTHYPSFPTLGLFGETVIGDQPAKNVFQYLTVEMRQKLLVPHNRTLHTFRAKSA